MRFLVFGEHDPVEQKAVEERSALIMREREKNPGKYTKIVLDVHILAGELPRQTQRVGWVEVVDVEDPKQLADTKAYFISRGQDVKSDKVHFVPLVEMNPAFSAEISYQRKLIVGLQATCSRTTVKGGEEEG